mgnify:CR=1 FL=1
MLLIGFPGGWELIIILFFIGILGLIYFLGYRHGRRSEKLKQLEDKV